MRATAIALLQLGRPRDAAQLFREVLVASDPLPLEGTDRASALFDLAVAHEVDGKVGLARQAYEEALTCDPTHFPAGLNLCALLLGRLKFEDAVRASGALVQRHPAQPDAWNNHAQALLANAQYAAAEVAVDRALELQPKHLGGRCAKALVLAMAGQIDEALARLNSIRADPATAELLPLHPQAEKTLQFDREALEHAHRVALFERYRRGDWTCFELYRRGLASLADAIRAGSRSSVTPMEAFQAMVMGLAREDYLTLVGRAAELFAESVTPLPRPVLPLDRKRARRIRIAYISPAFRAHPCGYLFRRLFAAHDRSAFEVFGYALGGDDGSAVRSEIVAGFDSFVDLGHFSDEEAAQRIRADGIDILVELEGFLDDTRPRVMAMRPAAVQVSYAGMMGTLEAPFIDYRFSDRMTEGAAPARGYSREQPVFLPGSFLPYGCPLAPWSAEVSRRAADLPEHVFVFCSFNAGFKFDPVTLASWMKILALAPGAVLWLLVPSDEQWGAITRLAEGSGIGRERLIRAGRLPNDDYLSRLRLADLFLDSYFCNAHTTALDALWMELPILTRSGDTPAARYCGSLLHELGLADLVASDEDCYVRTAVELAHNPAVLAGVRERLASSRQSAVTFDPGKKASQLEAAYRQMWMRYVAGHPPEAFDVAAV